MPETGYAVTYCRLEKGWTQAQLARKCGIPQPNLSNIEKGKKDLTLSTLKRISYALGIPPGHLLEGPYEGGGRKPKLTRRFVEEVARAVVHPRPKVSEEAEELANLFKDILPSQGRGKTGTKQMHLSWMKLRSRLNSQEIRTIYERIRDVQMRKP